MTNGEDERTDLRALRETVSALRADVAKLCTMVKALEEAAKSFVRQEEFLPVRIVVYGIVASVLTAVFMALLLTVIGRVGN